MTTLKTYSADTFSIAAYAFFLLLMSNIATFAMTFTLSGTGGNCNGCEWIAADGEITSSTPNEFANFVQKHKMQNYKMTVKFNSPGGSLYGGIQLGKLIRQYGFVTYVGKTVPDSYNWQTTKNGICLSACVFAFIGGITRSAKADELGIHQFYNDYAVSNPDARLFNAKDLSVQQQISGILISYAAEMGVSSLLIAKSSSIAPNDMYFLTKNDLIEMKILQDNDQFEPWEIKANNNNFFLQSTTPDRNQEAYIFCSNKTLYFSVYAKFLGSNEIDRRNLSSYIKDLSAIHVMGVTLSPQAVTAKISNEIVGIQISLPRGFSEKATIARPVVFGDIYRAASGYFTYILSNNNLANGLRIIERNCYQN